MSRSTAALILLAAVACCVAADGRIKADNSAATVDLDPTSTRDLLILGIRTHEAKKAATEQVKANANQGTATGDKAAAKAVTHQNRAGVAVPGVTGTSGRHLLEEEKAPTRDLLILGYRTHEAKKAAAAQVKANANAGTAKGDKEAAKALKYQNRAGVAVPGVTGVSGRHLLEEESDAANRNLLIFGIKTHEAKKAAKNAVKEQSHAKKAGLVQPVATTAPTGRRLQEAAARDLLILGYRTHEAKKAAAAQVKANANAGTAKGDKEAAKALKYQNRAGVTVPGVTGVSGRHLLEKDSEAANRNLLIFGIKTHEAKKTAKYAVKEQSHAKKAGLLQPVATTTTAGRRLLEEQEAAARNLLILGIKTHEAKKAAKSAVKEQSHAQKAGLVQPVVTTAPTGRHLLEEQEAAARNLLILGIKTHEAKKAAKYAVKEQSHANKAGLAQPTPTTSTMGRRHLLEKTDAAARNLLILGIKTHEAKKAAKYAVKEQSHAKKAGLAQPTPTMSTMGRRHLLEETDAAARNLLILGIRTHEAKKAAAEQVKANANQGTAKGEKAAAKAQSHANKAGVPVPGVTATSGHHL